jgi:hypothetical protein
MSGASAAVQRPFHKHHFAKFGFSLEHDPEKACPPDLIRGWKPVFGKDHAQMQNLDHDSIQLNWIMV